MKPFHIVRVMGTAPIDQPTLEYLAAQLVERKRREARPRVSMEDLAITIWPRTVDPETGKVTGDPKNQWSLLFRPNTNGEKRRLRLGEFVQACHYFEMDPVYTLIEALNYLKSGVTDLGDLASSKPKEEAPPKKRGRPRKHPQAAPAVGQ